MSLQLKNISKRDGAETLIHPTDLVLADGSFNVLLGTTLAGKTTLMQLMAGIQKPSEGEIWFRGRNVTNMPVQKRNVSFVYQQFINYPNLSVYDNIASPLRVAGLGSSEIEARVERAADLLRLKPMLKRRPSELSGGQQQRTAIARAVVKDSDLILLDEPLANLDYKLREELREELPRLFAGRNAIVVYATTEPAEALLFGGHAAAMFEGRVTQYGPTSEIYRKPSTLVSAQVFSDPPVNAVKISKKGDQADLGWAKWKALRFRTLPDGDYIMGIRPHHISAGATGDKTRPYVEGRVLVTELSGSESIIHIEAGGMSWVSLSSGIHPLQIGEVARLSVDIERALFFSANGEAVS